MYRKILESIEKEFNLEVLKRHSAQIYLWERNFSYRDFFKSSGYCFEQFKRAGISGVSKTKLPADGRTTYMDFIIPEAWDIDDAVLEIVEPVLSEKILANHRDEAFCVANRCAPTPAGGVVAEVVTEERMKQAKEVKGKVVFTKFSHPKSVRQEVIRKGGIGIISSFSKGYLDAPDGTWWINGWGSPGWYHTHEDKKIFCFSITPRKGEYLTDLMRTNTVKVKAFVKSRIYDSSVYSVTGLVPGEKEEEILLLAHIYEPFITDDAIGAACLIEIGRILTALIKRGELPALKRSIRFLLSQERYGFAEFFQDRKRRKRILLAINMDSVSMDCKKTGLPVKVRMSPASLPFFGDFLLRDMADYCLPAYPREIEKGNLSDDTFMSDITVGVPSNWLWSSPGRFHHNSCNSFDRMVDWNLAGKIVGVIAGYVYFLASADMKNVHWLKDLILRNIKMEMQKECMELRTALAEKQVVPHEALEKLEFLSGWQKGRILSFGRFFRGSGAEKLRGELGKVVKEEKRNLLLGREKSVTNESLTRKGKLAKNVILERKTLGFPFCLAKVPPEERVKHPGGVEQILNWVDGKRDLLEILRLYRCETGIGLGEKEISCLMRYLVMLDKYGYLKVRYRIQITKEDIKKSLRKLGIKGNDNIMVHSSLAGIGHVKGGAKTVCRALMELVTKEGVLIMPSFNHYVPFKEDGPGYYSPEETPTINGEVPDTFWRMKGVHRSLNPSHPFAVWGKEAKRYVKDHHRLFTMGEGSPLHLLEREGGKVVLIDCPRANTFHHVVEMTNNVPCLGRRTEEYPVKLPDGGMVRVRTWGWRNASCQVSEGGAYWEEMKKLGFVTKGTLGNAQVSVINMKDCREVIEEFLKGKKKGFGGCKNCRTRPRIVPATVRSDWDAKNKKVRTDTTAFVGDYL